MLFQKKISKRLKTAAATASNDECFFVYLNSSMAGGINALAAVTILDVLNPIYTKRTGNKQFPPKQLLVLFKGLGQFKS
jgi:hypothetical protein